MARTTHVRKAQQRYKTVVVRDDEGHPKRTPVMKKVKDWKTGEVTEVQKTTKTGRPVFMTVTMADKSQPLDPETCDHCHRPIEVGTPYKHITPKSGPYGGRKRSRHESCPSWNVWDYSNSLSAQLARISHDFWESVSTVESEDDVQSALDDAASSVREIAEQKEESAGNIEEGFGHETSASEELRSIAEQLEEWASEIESAEVPDFPEVEERYFVTNGDGVVSDLFETEGYETEMEAEQALASHRTDNGTEEKDGDYDDGFEIEAIIPDEPTEDQMAEWREEVESTLTIVDESPV